jgi:hypothetical protein
MFYQDGTSIGSSAGYFKVNSSSESSIGDNARLTIPVSLVVSQTFSSLLQIILIFFAISRLMQSFLQLHP